MYVCVCVQCVAVRCSVLARDAHVCGRVCACVSVCVCMCACGRKGTCL